MTEIEKGNIALNMRTGFKNNLVPGTTYFIDELKKILLNNGIGFTDCAFGSEMGRSKKQTFLPISKGYYLYIGEENIKMDIKDSKKEAIVIRNIVWRYIDKSIKNGDNINILEIIKETKRSRRFVCKCLSYMEQLGFIHFDRNKKIYIKDNNYNSVTEKFKNQIDQILETVLTNDRVSSLLNMIKLAEFSEFCPIPREYFKQITKGITEKEEIEFCLALGHERIRISK